MAIFLSQSMYYIQCYEITKFGLFIYNNFKFEEYIPDKASIEYYDACTLQYWIQVFRKKTFAWSEVKRRKSEEKVFWGYWKI